MFPLRVLRGCAALLLAAAAARARAEAPVVEEGELAGARYALARPAGPWNHRLLLLAHDQRRAEAPLLPGLVPLAADARALVAEGWIVAATSYRRNGLVLADAIADLDLLRAHLAEQFGEPRCVILEGTGMGGLIVTLMAERDLDGYDGALALGPALAAKESNQGVGLSLQPKVPLLFLANRGDTRGAAGYVTARIGRPKDVVLPALFLIARDGRASVNAAERLGALHALEAWIADGRDRLPAPGPGAAFFDATVPPPDLPTGAVPLAGGGCTAEVTAVSALTGEAELALGPGDFARAGIAPMMYFELRHGDTLRRVLYGRDGQSVRRGEWVAYPDAEGRTQLARREGDAGAEARLQAGERLEIRPYPAP